jgi:S1-C subfamily serine protease
MVPALSVLLLCGVLAAQPAQPAPSDSSRPYIGVAVGQSADKDGGIVVREVAPDSPAAKAELKQGDVILKLNGESVKDAEAFVRSIAAKKPGEKVAVLIRRDGKEQTINATLAQRPGSQLLPAAPGEFPRLQREAFLGVQVESLSADLRKKNLKAEAGVVVTEVVPNSPAARAGLQTDDVITAVDKNTVRSAADLRQAIQKAGAGKEVNLHIFRGKEEKSVKATLQEGPMGFRFEGDRLPFVNIEPLVDSGKLQELQRRIDAMEKRLNELEKKPGAAGK